MLFEYLLCVFDFQFVFNLPYFSASDTDFLSSRFRWVRYVDIRDFHIADHAEVILEICFDLDISKRCECLSVCDFTDSVYR